MDAKIAVTGQAGNCLHVLIVFEFFNNRIIRTASDIKWRLSWFLLSSRIGLIQAFFVDAVNLNEEEGMKALGNANS